MCAPVFSANDLLTGSYGAEATFCVWVDDRHSQEITAGRPLKDCYRIIVDS